MNGVEEITYQGKVLAKVFRGNQVEDGVQFFTSQDNPFQVGMHSRKKGVSLTPHIHVLEKPLVVDVIQEILFVQSGKIRLTLYTDQGKVIERKTLATGDSVLLLSGAHGVDILEDAKIFEVKQGPYPGVKHAKIYL